jgi:enamine deaminase RidA (YjgF/YER057c/UK114 family)
VEAGGLLFLSGMLPVKEGRPAFIGRVGIEISPEEGRQAARLAALNGLAVARSTLGSLDRIARLVRLVVHIAGATDFGDHANVADGASEMLASVFGQCGSHARLAVGALSLPAHMPIELEMVFELT